MRAVAYLRRSSTKQEASITAQRQAVAKYAADNGLTVVREYVDDGISGNKLEERKAFLQMRHDMTVENIADRLIVWGMDRLSRHDGMKAAAVLEPFRDACIEIHTVRENKIVDLTSLGGCLENFIQSENNHDYLRKLSSNTLGGRLRGAKQGHVGGQSAPYGFDRIVVDAAGNHVLRLKNGDPKPTRAADTHVTFVPSDDSEVLQTVRWIFDEYANSDVSQRAICDQLNRRGIRGGRGGKWSPSTLGYILKNENYVGSKSRFPHHS
ncbi:MAG: recombinase family protein [Fuerstiella sp.]|nr:recombinase family protein [Fuerstiella sp.]